MKYKMPVRQAIIQVFVDHPETRLTRNRKLLLFYVMAKYDPNLQRLFVDHPDLPAIWAQEFPDSDTILRETRTIQNDEGIYTDADARQILGLETFYDQK